MKKGLLSRFCPFIVLTGEKIFSDIIIIIISGQGKHYCGKCLFVFLVAISRVKFHFVPWSNSFIIREVRNGLTNESCRILSCLPAWIPPIGAARLMGVKQLEPEPSVDGRRISQYQPFVLTKIVSMSPSLLLNTIGHLGWDEGGKSLALAGDIHFAPEAQLFSNKSTVMELYAYDAINLRQTRATFTTLISSRMCNIETRPVRSLADVGAPTRARGGVWIVWYMLHSEPV